jgi:hypothetical protein
MSPYSKLFFFAIPILAVATPNPTHLYSKLEATKQDITPQLAQHHVLQMINNKVAATPAELSPLWSALPPIKVANVLGTYHGGLFTGNSTNGTAKADPINWYGKQFISETSVNPLLVNPPPSVPNAKNIVFPYPRADIAQVRNLEHEGVVSATIIYNKLPLMDYFRVVKNSDGELILLGKSDLKGKLASPPFFYLKKVDGVEIDFKYKNP